MDAADLVYAGIARQAELVRAGEVSPRELVEACLERIGRRDPQLNAFRVVFAERALLEADQASARRRADEARPLLGVPIAIKDDVDVAGEPTCVGAGSWPPPAAADSEVVARLRAAGAIVIGKTNVPELTQWPFTESATFGVTRNPWSQAHTPGGSSGGSAAAVAGGLVGAALGTDGAGSIRIPAACCGLFGIKPQRGRISTLPKADAWQGMTVYGPLTHSVRDAALFLDATAAEAPERPFVDAAATPPGALRVAVSTKVPPGLIARLHPEQRRAFDETVDALRALGHEVHAHDPAYGLVGSHVIARYLRGIADDAAHVPEPRRLERRTRAQVRLGRLIPAARMARVREAEAAHAARLNASFDQHDVLLTPGLAAPPLEVGRYEGHGQLWTLNGSIAFTPYTAPWNALGNPAASVPAGFTPDGLPLAVQLVGRPDDEATLLALAAQLEAARPWAERRPPVI